MPKPNCPSIYLAPTSSRQVMENIDAFGFLASPRTWLRSPIIDGAWWALDNDCFNNGGELDVEAWMETLRTHHPHRERCLFVAVPDVPYDGVSTLEQFGEYADGLREDGWPVALVTQNGMNADDSGVWIGDDRDITDYIYDKGLPLEDDHDYWNAVQSWRTYVTWDELDALFVGGDDEHKLRLEASYLIREAQKHGKWVHIGRVNSALRIRAFWRADSWDGTTISREPQQAVGIATAVREVRAMKEIGTLWQT